MVTVANLVAMVSVQGATKAKADLLGMSMATQDANTKFAKLAGGAILGVGVAVVAIAAQARQMAADYEQSMNKVQALTGSSTAQMQLYDSSLKTLAVSAGVAPKALADGLYNVLSAGYKGADAMRVLTLSVQDSKIGMTSASVASDALTNVMASFSTKVGDATRVNGEMLQTVTLGKATFEQYATTIVKSASAAAQFHVSMETMNAAWATMTSSGIRAAQASTDFQASLKVMDGNIGTVVKSLNKSGIAFNETKFNAMSYGDKVVYLNRALDEATAKHVKVTGVTLQAAQAINTIATHIGVYNSDLATLSNKQEMAKKTQEAWAITQSGFNQKMSEASAAVQVLMIDLGQKLLPSITGIVGAITPVITSFTAWITTGNRVQEWINDTSPQMILLKGALLAVSGAIIASLVVAFASWAYAAGLAAIATIAATWPILAIGALIALVVVGIILAVQHWGAIMDWITGRVNDAAIKTAISHENMKVAALQKTDQQQQGVLANLEKERTGVLDKLKSMADGADKIREQQRLKSLDTSIKQANDNIAQTEKEKQQHLQKLKELAAQDLEARKGWYDRANDATTNWFNDMGNTIKSGYNRANNDTSNWFASMNQRTNKGYGDLDNAVGNWIHNLGTSIANGYNSANNATTRWMSSMNAGISSGFHAFVNGIINALNLGVTGIENFVNLMGSGVDWIAGKLGAGSPVPHFAIGRIPSYADGTSGHPGGMAIVGEKGPELVSLPRGASVLPATQTASLLGSVPGYAGGVGDVLGAIGGTIKSMTSDIASWITGGAGKVLDSMISQFNIKLVLPGQLSQLASGTMGKVKDMVLAWIKTVLPSLSSLGGTAVNVPGNVTSWLLSAMGLTGVPMNWLGALASIAMHESGGNPSAINLTDSNAQAGHPSQGLMQTIPSTFAAYMVAGHGNILNPIDNAAAAINYIKSRYGSVLNVPGIASMMAGKAYVGYADGTSFAAGGLSVVGEKGPEVMYVPRGAQITPNNALRSGGSTSQAGGQPIIMQLDGVQFATVFMPYFVSAVRNNVGTHNI